MAEDEADRTLLLIRRAARAERALYELREQLTVPAGAQLADAAGLRSQVGGVLEWLVGDRDEELTW